MSFGSRSDRGQAWRINKQTEREKMKINIFQILNVVNMAMVLVENLKSKKTKTERIEAAIDLASPFVQALEVSFGKNLLKEEMIKPLVEDYITAAKTLVNGIQRFKDLKESDSQTKKVEI